jgi:hypothetical protein
LSVPQSRELADGNPHAARTLVPESEDALVVGGHDEPDALAPDVPEQLRDALDVVRSDPQATGPAHDVAELPARVAHRRGVDEGSELFEVLDQQAVEEPLVAILEGRQPDVLLQVVALAVQVLQLELDLLRKGRDPRRQQPPQAHRLALGVGEGRVLVEHR